jgi:hypothetical protein
MRNEGWSRRDQRVRPDQEHAKKVTGDLFGLPQEQEQAQPEFLWLMC